MRVILSSDRNAQTRTCTNAQIRAYPTHEDGETNLMNDGLMDRFKNADHICTFQSETTIKKKSALT